MASNPYVKSVLWLVGFGGIGYGLMLLTEPNAEKIERIKASVATTTTRLSEDERKKMLFMKKMQEVATGAPIYWAQTPDKKDN